ncbi:MAG: ribonuclease III [Candidatus Yonathbacteria bacterium]|nr:ribonuclease III [Candidatus Yonathbacteria bacterium]NTW47779.1 ribonuclease III [Candidatus Yonathbacteria bacterium]
MTSPINPDICDTFEKRAGVAFVDKMLLQQAFTHRSYLNEHVDLPHTHNERLEFLGDAVLELSVTDFLYRTYPQKTEGDLTAYRAALVNTISISNAAKDLRMDECLLLSRGEARGTEKARQYILANTFEAVIGAIYLDQGYAAADAFINRHLTPYIAEVIKRRLWQDAKSYFQERAQDEVGITPSYSVLEEVGPDHDKEFTVGVYLGNELVAKGTGRSKQDAEQEAANKGLDAKAWRKE